MHIFKIQSPSTPIAFKAVDLSPILQDCSQVFFGSVLFIETSYHVESPRKKYSGVVKRVHLLVMRPSVLKVKFICPFGIRLINGIWPLTLAFTD